MLPLATSNVPRDVFNTWFTFFLPDSKAFWIFFNNNCIEAAVSSERKSEVLVR